MSNLNKLLLESSYNWFVEHGLRPHIACYGKDLIKSPALMSSVQDTEVFGLQSITLNINPAAAPIEFTEDYLHVKCRSNGTPCEEFIPYENIWVIFEPDNPLLTLHLPQHLFLPEQIDFKEIKKERVALKENSKPKLRVISSRVEEFDGGKS